jgi:hypothetical protein
MAPDWTGIGSDLAKEGEEMSTPAQIGKYEWQSVLTEARSLKAELRTLLRRTLEHYDISSLAQACLKIDELNDLINRLEEIGRNTKP